MRKDIFDFFSLWYGRVEGKEIFLQYILYVEYLFNVYFFNSQVSYKVQLFQLHKNYRIEICYKILVSCLNPHRHYDAKGLGIGHIVL